MILVFLKYIYKTTNTINGKIYIGKSEKDVIKTKTYYGSGLLLNKAITKYGKELNLKQFHCQKNNCNDLFKVRDPYINIYVKLTDVCQAKCKFCDFCNGNTNFDTMKLYYILSELQKKVVVNKVSFTGGEPTINFDAFVNTVKVAREACPKSFFNVNTNGYHLDQLDGMGELDCIALSRHHYNEKTNAELFGLDNLIRLPLNSEIEKFKDKHKIHFSCNLVKGYIDNEEEICKYLDWSASVGVYDVGFVTLMKVNEFCKENHVDFRDIEFSKEHNMFHNQTWKNGNTCECRNYLYNPLKSNGVVKVYTRYNYDHEKGASDSNLVFDGTYLRRGFGGDIII